MLTACDPTAVYMIEQLRRESLLEDVFRVVWRPLPSAPRSTWTRLKRLTPSRAWERLNEELNERRFAHLHAEASRELFGRSEPPAVEITDCVEAHAINGEAFAARLAKRPPDVLLVNGAPILKERVFSLARTSAINCHFGIAPRYRGSFTLFWPLFFRDYDHVGVTLHQLTRGLDAGPVIGHGYPALGPGDGEGRVMGKCARVATELVLDYLEALREGRAVGMPQPHAGRLYRKRDRTGLHDVWLWVERALGLSEVPLRPPRRLLLG